MKGVPDDCAKNGLFHGAAFWLIPAVFILNEKKQANNNREGMIKRVLTSPLNPQHTTKLLPPTAANTVFNIQQKTPLQANSE
jgi:hypothetical protein